MAEINERRLALVNEAVDDEFRRATGLHKPFHSSHEGFAILLEEVDELWDAVKLNNSNATRNTQMRKEAIHVAAMALRFLHDVSFKDEAVD